MVRFTVNIDTRDRSFYVWDAVNVKRVGNGKGEELSFLSEQDATTVRDEMTARTAHIAVKVDNLPGLALLSMASPTMRSLFVNENMGDLSADDFTKVARPNSERVSLSRVRELMSVPADERPRVYALWNDQIVSVTSTYYVNMYAEDARAWWIGHTTVQNMICPA